MQMFRRILGTTLAVMLCAPAASAQQTHVINKSALDQAVQQRVHQEQTDRDAIHDFLQNPQVKSVAAKAGLSIEKAEAAVWRRERVCVGRRAVRGGRFHFSRSRAAAHSRTRTQPGPSFCSISAADRSALRRRRRGDGDAVLGGAGYLP